MKNQLLIRVFVTEPTQHKGRKIPQGHHTEIIKLMVGADNQELLTLISRRERERKDEEKETTVQTL